MSSGKIVQIIGAVVDVEFPRDAMPKVYDALNVEETGLTLEVQQQLGDGVVRSIAMGSTDGIKRESTVSNTGAPISVPVGEKTWVASWTCWVIRWTNRAHWCGNSLPIHRRHRPMRTRRPPLKFWKPASRLSTWSCPLPRAARLVVRWRRCWQDRNPDGTDS